MSLRAVEKQPEQQVGRYAIFDRLASGGMASVHIARLLGREGFSRVVAAKRMHRHFLEDSAFRRMFLEEARLAARVRHPNVVPIVDVLSQGDEIILVMEYVHGESLQALTRLASGAPFPIPIACAIMTGTLHGLHAAHEARNERGEPLGIVHRDVSPHNILVGADGVVRVADFGVAKAVHAREDSAPGVVKGKVSFLAPEVVRGAPATRRSDIFSAATVFWELLAGRRLFAGATEQERLLAIVNGNYPALSAFNARVPEALERLVAKGLMLEATERYETALEFAIEVEREVQLASQRAVGDWVERLAADELERRANLIHEVETSIIGPISMVRNRLASDALDEIEEIEELSEAVAVLGSESKDGGRGSKAAPSAPRTTTSARWLPVLLGLTGLVLLTLALLIGLRTNGEAQPSAKTGPSGLSPPASLPSVDTGKAPNHPPTVASGSTPLTASAPAESAPSATVRAAPSSSNPRPAPPPSAAPHTKIYGKPFLPSEL
ncbi:MAG TPA: serine/threonine-protein kinase [Polyangiaceae bacterium]|nr:serine/threonine-protein kinase [Polyangiaceae bacterium]